MVKKLGANIYVLGIPVLLMIGIILFVQSAYFINPSASLSRAITLDIIITVPLLYYLLIRKKTIPKFTVFTVFVVSVLLAGFILPDAQQGFLTEFKKYVIPVIEIALIVIVFYKVYQFRNSLKLNDQIELDTYQAIKDACNEILPNGLAQLFATELGVFYYVFFARSIKSDNENHFSYFEKSGIKSTIYVLIFIILVEMLVMHILVEQWNVTVAWILTLLGAYTCLQVFALVRSMDKRLIKIDKTENKLMLNYGLFNHSVIALDNIVGIEINSKSLPSDKSILELSPLGLLDRHNLILHLEKEEVLHKMYGLKKTYKSIAIFIDEKDKFNNSILQIINSKKENDKND